MKPLNCIFFSIWILLSYSNFAQNINFESDTSINTYLYTTDSIQEPKIQSISFTLSELKQLNFGTDLVNDSLLLYSIYANYDSSTPFIDSDNNSVSVWQCDRCSTNYFEDRNESKISELTIDTLPYRANYTSITQKKYYKDSLGIDYCLVSFSTSDGYPPAGRYSSGLLSLVLLKKELYWKIENFNLFVNYQGRFNTASTFDTIIDNWILINGGVANPEIWQVTESEYVPIYTNLYLIDLKTLQQKLVIYDYSCYSIYKTKGSYWDGAIKIVNSNIEIKINGKIEKKNYWGNYNVDREIKNQKLITKLPKKFKFKFKFNCNYFYNIDTLLNTHSELKTD